MLARTTSIQTGLHLQSSKSVAQGLGEIKLTSSNVQQ